jgi:hypothetical protein
LGTIIALVGLRRWRHLAIFLGCVVAVALSASQLAIFQARVRPLGVTIIGSWDGFSFPSLPVAALAVTLVGMVYALLPSGRPRSRGKWVVGAILVLLALVRMYLAVDNPSDLVAGIVLGVAVPVVAFRFFAPNEVFPVTYRRAKAAHLDVGGRRGQAIRIAVQEQLGLTVLDVQPVGLEGSAGSTPLRLRVAANDTQPERDLFAKLYARPAGSSHVRPGNGLASTPGRSIEPHRGVITGRAGGERWMLLSLEPPDLVGDAYPSRPARALDCARRACPGSGCAGGAGAPMPDIQDCGDQDPEPVPAA